MKQNNIFKPTLKFSEKTSVSNVNVSNDNFRLSELSWHPGYVVKFDSIDSCKNRYYTNNTQGSHSFTKQSYKVCIVHCFSYIARQSIINYE